jgi:hypothetical protein
MDDGRQVMAKAHLNNDKHNNITLYWLNHSFHHRKHYQWCLPQIYIPRL